MQDFENWESDWVVGIARACLNRADLGELWRYRRTVLTPVQGDMLRVVQAKIDRQPEKFGRERQRYDQMAGLVLMSNWHRAIDFCTCMDQEARKRYRIMTDKRPVRNCGLWRICAHCAWRREFDLQKRFLTTFNAGMWSWLTPSFTGNLPMLSCYLNPNHPFVSHADLHTYFQAIRFAVKTMYHEGRIRGAILTDDLHLESLHPVPLVTPHAHILVLTAEPLTQDDLDHFKALMVRHRGLIWDLVSGGKDDPGWSRYDQKRQMVEKGLLKTKPRKPPFVMVPDSSLKVELPISLDLQPVPTQKDFEAVLGYPAKPVDLVGAYVKARAMLLRENPQNLDLLAQNVDEFIMGCDLILSSLKSPFCIGACDARRKRGTPYIGVPGKSLADEAHRDQTKALLAKLNPKADTRHQD